jgi:hypothetical protein
VAHEQYPEIGKLIRERKYRKAITRALQEWECNPEALVMCASTLYSARKDIPGIQDWFEPLVYPLSERIEFEFEAGNADALDVIASTLLWWGWVVKEGDWLHAREASRKALNLGLKLTQDEPYGLHTRMLLQLTFADMLFRTHNRRFGMLHLKEAARHAFAIRDPDQRSRVFRKAGWLYFMQGHFKTGIALYLQARSVPGIALSTQRKNFPL